MPRLLASLLVASVSLAENPQPYRLTLALDGPLLGGSIALFIGARMVKGEVGGPDCFPCDPDDLNALDRKTLDYGSEGADFASDITRDILIYGALAGDLVDILLTRGRFRLHEYASDFVVLAEVFFLNDGLTSLTKAAVRRPRPDAYKPDEAPGAGRLPRNSESFYSGHTSTAFAFGTAATMTFWRRHPRSPARWIVAGACFALASATGVLRVAGGQHHPTDVIVGALAGSAVGAAVPLLHERGVAVGPGTLAWRF